MVEILLWVAVVLLIVLVVWVLRQRPVSFREDAERIERTVREENRTARDESAGTLSRFQTELKDDMARQDSRSREDFKMLVQSLGERMDKMALFLKEQNEAVARALKENTLTLETKLQSIREDNEKQLERMRLTVDEKLQSTLEKRLTESFKRVTDQLETVHKGLGEMHSLAVNVGDLKNVLTNVKIRGTWGEYQLGNILQQMLSPDQYGQNVHPNPAKASNVVEYAVKLPGNDASDIPVYLPIDAKFPKEDYELLVNASEAGDPEEPAGARADFRQGDPRQVYRTALYDQLRYHVHAGGSHLCRSAARTGLFRGTPARVQSHHYRSDDPGGLSQQPSDGFPHLGHHQAQRRNLEDALGRQDRIRQLQHGARPGVRPGEQGAEHPGKTARGLETIDGAQAQHLLGLDAASNDAGEEEAL